MIEIFPIGGYSKVEGNSILIKVDNESVILDMGLTMDNYVQFQNSHQNLNRNKYYDELLKVDAVPDYYSVQEHLNTVKAIIPSHAHLDHVGAIPYGAKFFKNIEILGTPYTIAFLKKEIKNTGFSKYFKHNKISLKTFELNSKYKVSKNITVEFIEVTHSIPDSAILAIHTPYGVVIYAVDYKFDQQPQLGNPPNYSRLKELGKEGVKCLILESLYADYDIETPSEEDVKKEILNIFSKLDTSNKTIITSTFSSHIVRLKTLVDTGQKLGRKVCLLGRSLNTHSSLARDLNITDLKSSTKIVSRFEEINNLLENVYANREKYFLICTGHQGEEFSVLSRIIDNWFDYSFSRDDIMLFSSSVIPTELNQASFSELEAKMRNKGLNIIKDVHASGHAGLKDHKKMLEMVNPETIIPAHAGHDKAIHIKNLSDNINIGKTILTQNGDHIKVT
jgi:ribonuclease J